MMISCELDGVCDDLLLGSMKKRRSTVFTWTIIFVMLYVYYVLYKKYKQNHRLSSDKKVYEKLVSGKDDFFVFFHTLEVFCNTVFPLQSVGDYEGSVDAIIFLYPSILSILVSCFNKTSRNLLEIHRII